MKSFSYFAPTRVIFGSDALDHLDANLKQFSPKKILVLYGSGSVIKSGVLDKVTKVLDESKYEYIKVGGVQANPLLSFAEETRDKAIEAGVDFVLAVGGGSVIDTAKGVSIGVANPGEDLWEFWLGNKPIEKALPHANILTISAAGSETSQSAVLTNDTTHLKKGINTDFNRPRFCLLNPEFTFTLPKFQVACGAVDILMHTMDRYFSVTDNNEMTDQMAEALMRVVFKYAKTAVANPSDYQAMSELMWAGSLSHVGLTGLGTGGDWTPHQLSHELSGFFNATHGAALSTTWNGFASNTYKTHPERFARYGRNVFALEGEDLQVAEKAIEMTLAYFKELDMPITIGELLGRTITEEELDAIALSCSFNKSRSIGSLIPRDYDGIREVYAWLNK